MFGFRSDGKKVKDLPPFFKLIPHIMKTRSDSQVYYSEDVPIANLDAYINKKAEEGIKISYMHIIYAAMVRLMISRPNLNRFVMNGITYQRNGVHISLAIKKELNDDGTETIIKLPFKGSENLFEIKEKLEDAVINNKDLEHSNNTDFLAKFLSIIPNFLIKFAVGILKFLDKRGLMPMAIIKASPFHASAFLTNVASLGIDAIFHHIYDFGTTSIFLAMGKKKKSYIYDDDNFREEKCISLAFVCDERICDGYYFATAVKQFKRYLKKPELLEENFKNQEKEDINKTIKKIESQDKNVIIETVQS